MIHRDEATEAQVRAASPLDSTWLSANAGSGKTRVLTDRVARLLLEGVLPQHILCLTYTKAAASEMQNRLFKRLGGWAMLDDDKLRQDLQVLGVPGAIDENRLRKARQLFARAIESPGGLKIQTIHSFCAALLRRFPLEAGVSPQFTEMDDRAARLLRQDIIEEMAISEDDWRIKQIAPHFTGVDFADFAGAVARQKSGFRFPVDPGNIWKSLGLEPGFDEEQLMESILLPDDNALIARVIQGLAQGSANDIKAADALNSLSPDEIFAADLPVLEKTFLFGGSTKVATPFTAKIGKFPTKSTRAAMDADMDALNSLMRRVEQGRAARLSLGLARRSLALHHFAAGFLPPYAEQKQSRGWLDFDDLIYKARDLLTDPMVAQWVLFRLDGGIDHILVDEAQDTSPIQWQVIQNLAQEFTAGQGARADVARTIFVVGDKKQSIYSFQGADPREFDRMSDYFRERLVQFQRLNLAHSFRSSSAILAAVDNTFNSESGHPIDQEMGHIAFKDAMPGRVDLWPVIEPTDETDDRHWSDPVDKLSQNHHNVVLARTMAQEIRRMIDQKVTIPAEIGQTGRYESRPVTPGDFLILVQGRSGIFPEIILACKSEGLAIAGADRLKIGGELAVKDLTALLSFLATPEDDLSLAAVLRSPLFGWSEQELFDLAHRRAEKSFLWAGLRERAEEFPETYAILTELRDQADFLRPYELLETCLTNHGGRAKLIARLGREAEDGIDALLNEAINFERGDVPSLTLFLTWLQSEEVEIKRQMDSAGDQIRVMTVHGAKGLESPIVILPDTTEKPKIKEVRDPLAQLEDGAVIWRPSSDVRPPRLDQMHQDKIELQRAENLRLLYVAMTRAEKWLITCGAGRLPKDGTAWHQIIQQGLTHAGSEKLATPLGDGMRYSPLDWDGLPMALTATLSETQAEALPAWADQPAPAPAAATKPLSPSDMGGAKALPGDSGLTEQEAMARGTAIHSLLEHLPGHDPQNWLEISAQILGDAFSQDVYDEAHSVLINPDLAHVFAPETLVEVDVSAQLDGQPMLGKIDALIVADDTVTVIDFKSNAIVPDNVAQTPLGLLRQMGAYVRALEQIYPNHRIIAQILWTRTATITTLEHSDVMNALNAVIAP